jgi:hypothetical protein
MVERLVAMVVFVDLVSMDYVDLASMAFHRGEWSASACQASSDEKYGPNTVD